MKKIFFIVIIFGIIYLSGVMKVIALTLDELVERVQATYEKTETIEALFNQEAFIKSVGQKENNKGKVYIKKPGRIRWEYDPPEEQLIVSNGENLWVYYPADKQVIKKKIDDVYSFTSSLFITGKGKLKNDFLIKEGVAGFKSDKGEFVLELTPKEQQINLQKLVMYLNPKSFQIEASTMYDLYGNITTIRFSKMEINKDISANLFNFTIPQGVEIIE